MGRERPFTRGRGARVLIPALLLVVGVCAGGSVAGGHARAATPPSGTINGSAPVPWDYAGIGGTGGGTDSYQLTVQLPSSAATYYAPDVRQGSTHAAVLQVTLTWTDSSADQTLGLSVTDSHGNAVGNDTLATTNDGSNINVFQLQDPQNDTYTVTASNQNGSSTAAIAAHAVATLRLIDLSSEAQPPNPSGGTGYDNYHLPLSLMPVKTEETQLGGRLFGEPSIGVDPRNNDVMYQAGLYTIRTAFNDATTPATASYTDVSFPTTSTASEDAILYVDRNTGRTFVSQLILACSLGAVSDNDGTTWTPATKPCQTPAAVDHETIGAGPFASPLPMGAVYPDAAYYCSQNVAEAECALSVDGGLNYGAASVMWTSDQCFGLHGHVKVAPNDGTVYVPDKACGSPECLIVTSTAGPNCHPGFAVSTNNGATWTVHTINDGYFRYFTTGDPSIGIGAHGTMYYGYNDRSGHPMIAVCTNQGTVCGPSKDVGTAFHIENTEMPTVVAGDDNRAAFAFLGSTTPGDDQENSFVGTWHVYVAVTYDGGATWTTSDATPDHPVQRGCIEFNASCPSTRGTDDQRNLLDFNDLTIDSKGRILYAYTDGCQMDGEIDPAGHGKCLTDATRLSGLPTEIEAPAIARQNCGLGLYAAFDGVMPSCSVGTALPETPHAAGLVVGGLVMIGGASVMAWRRRRHGKRSA
ncbi:MAG: hypothetical protein JO198_00520 [Candidatus Dormibacteraeota bacterium]|nr:hypothetical protein [Candidatus Dormibacteraeota bacterium]